MASEVQPPSRSHTCSMCRRLGILPSVEESALSLIPALDFFSKSQEPPRYLDFLLICLDQVLLCYSSCKLMVFIFSITILNHIYYNRLCGSLCWTLFALFLVLTPHWHLRSFYFFLISSFISLIQPSV